MFEGAVYLNNREWSAVILPDVGANTVRLRHKEHDLLRFPENKEQLAQSPYLYGMPIILPPNRIENGAFHFDGKAYQLEINESLNGNHIHGFFAEAPFEVVSLSSNQLTCVYENRGERYPFWLDLLFTVTLHEKGIVHQLEIVNRADGDIPVAAGFHTTFAEPETFSVPIGKRWETNARHIPTGTMLELSGQEQQYVRGCRPHGLSISGFYTAAGHEAQIGEYRYRTSDNFSQWVLFNGGGNKRFLCVEPQSGPVNSLNRPDGYIRLKRKASLRFWTTISSISRGGEILCPK